MRGAKCDFCGEFFGRNVSLKQTIEFRVPDNINPRPATEPDTGSQVFRAEITISKAEPKDERDCCDSCINLALSEEIP